MGLIVCHRKIWYIKCVTKGNWTLNLKRPIRNSRYDLNLGQKEYNSVCTRRDGELSHGLP